MTDVRLVPRRRRPNVCMRCSSGDCEVQHRSEVLDHKGITIEVEGLAHTVCRSCGHRWTTDGQDADNLRLIREAYAERRDKVREEQGLLTGQQIATVLSALGLSRTEAAALFGGGPHAFAKYIAGEVLQSVPMDRLLRLTLAFGKPAVDYLRQGKSAPLELHGAVIPAPTPGYVFAMHVRHNVAWTTLSVQVGRYNSEHSAGGHKLPVYLAGGQEVSSVPGAYPFVRQTEPCHQ